MAVLDDYKILKNITNTNKDGKINLFIRLGSTAIRNYIHIDNSVDIEANYPDALLQYVIEKMNNSGLEGQKQYSQGSRSGTLNNALSSDVKDLLPLPYVTLA